MLPGAGVVISSENNGHSAKPLEWKFSQVFGERSAGEDVQDGMAYSLLLIVCSFKGSHTVFVQFCIMLSEYMLHIHSECEIVLAELFSFI